MNGMPCTSTYVQLNLTFWLLCARSLYACAAAHLAVQIGQNTCVKTNTHKSKRLHLWQLHAVDGRLSFSKHCNEAGNAAKPSNA